MTAMAGSTATGRKGVALEQQLNAYIRFKNRKQKGRHWAWCVSILKLQNLP